MKRRLFFTGFVPGTLGILFVVISCQQNIKKTNARVEDEVVHSVLDTTVADPVRIGNENVLIKEEADFIGYWVGDFRNADNDSVYYSKTITLDEGLHWNRDNKINLSIDKVIDGKVYGHSVVAGNYRPFEGTYQFEHDKYIFKAKEPGDDYYDGTFEFEIAVNDSVLNGTWTAYKNVDIKNRIYDLQKKIYRYNPDQMLVFVRRYADWGKYKKTTFMNEIDEEAFEDFYLEFSSTTDSIYHINASNTLLKKEHVENLKRGDLFIIRNTIYARHGYSFKNRPLRVFFDAQPWYIPVHNDIKKDLTDKEKENIRLLMKYEKNAKEYYDTFGRG